MAHIDNVALCDFLEESGAHLVKRVVEQTLRSALAEIATHDARLGRPVAWGDLLHAVFTHPLSSQSDHFPIVGPFRQGGSESTVFHSGFDAATFMKLTGSTFRIVIDLADWDKSFCINAPGQSGDSRSSFYDAMAIFWAAGQVVPLLSSADAVRSAAKVEIELIPSR